jgi:taurine transport system substrate-binding protein
MTRIYLKEKEMKKTLGILLAAGSLWANISMAATPPEVRGL